MSAQSAYLIATLTSVPTTEELGALSKIVSALEVRADLVGDLDIAELRAAFEGQLIYTLRSRAEGGRDTSDPAERAERFARASESYDFLDLEANLDLHDQVLNEIPIDKRVLSWHGQADELEDLRFILAKMEASGGRYYKLIPEAPGTAEALLPLAFLKSTSRDDLISFASGTSGVWTRLLAPRLGAPWVYGSAGPEAAAPGQLSIRRLRRDYGLPDLWPIERLYGIAGNPVRHSLSPRLYNGMFRERGLPCAYLPFHVETFGDFWLDLVESGSLEELGFPLLGLSVTAPFKEIALAVSGATSPLAERIGSANTLTNRGGVWEAESTDPEGVFGPLRDRGVALAGLTTAVVGAGGAGRAAAFALARSGCVVTMVNRSAERGRRVATELDVSFQPLEDFDPGKFQLIVNATPLGRSEEDELPFDPKRLQPSALLIDLAYVPGVPTRLVTEVRANGATAIDGREVLLAQAIPQSLTMTGERLSPEQVRDLLDEEEAG